MRGKTMVANPSHKTPAQMTRPNASSNDVNICSLFLGTRPGRGSQVPGYTRGVSLLPLCFRAMIVDLAMR